MKIITTLAQVTRFLIPLKPFGYMPTVVRAIQDRYGFVGAPVNTEELFPIDVNKGATFRHGKLEAIVIDNLQVYHLGLVASTCSSTDDTDLFLNDLVQLFSRDFEIKFDEIRPQAYLNQFELQLSKPIKDFFVNLIPAAQEIPKLVGDFWSDLPQFEISSFVLSCDPSKVSGPPPASFKMERRLGVPYEKNLYLSEAPLRTGDHRRILEALFCSEKDL
jgi:hypothetical protein